MKLPAARALHRFEPVAASGLAGTLFLFLALLVLGGRDVRAMTDSAGALERGNRLFHRGDYAAALAAYRAGWDPARPDPVLAYDLGTTAHHLGQLPEAVLWYRRALAHRPALGRPDPWLVENLALARRELSATAMPPPAETRRLLLAIDALAPAGCLFAWAALALLLAARRRPTGTTKLKRTALAVAVTAAILFGAGLWLARRGPRAAVLLASCGGLPAGSEVWVAADRPAGGHTFEIVGEDADPTCPAPTVGLVEP